MIFDKFVFCSMGRDTYKHSCSILKYKPWVRQNYVNNREPALSADKYGASGCIAA